MRKYVFIGTFGLVFTVGCAVMGKAALAPRNSFYGLAIGFTVFTGATAVGHISGGAAHLHLSHAFRPSSE